jgi:hypothetical protein
MCFCDKLLSFDNYQKIMKKKKFDYTLYGQPVFYRILDENKDVRKELVSSKIIIARDSEKGKGSKNYMKFNSVDKLKLFIQKLPFEYKCLYEYRRETDNVKLFFDIDKKLSSETHELFINTFLETVIDSLIFSIQTIWQYKYLIRKDDFYIYDSSTSTKISYHIVINKYYLRPENIVYLNKIKKYATDLLKAKYGDLIDDTIIDSSIYSRRGCFRLLGSHKINQTNVKKVYSTQNDSNSLAKSMICMIDYDTSIEIEDSPIDGWQPDIEEDSKNQYEEIIENQSLKTNTIEYILENLNSERSDDYEKWIRVAFVLKNMGCDEELFHKFSKRSDKYDEKECSKIYNEIYIHPYPEKRLKIGSLLLWLKQDNPKAFSEFQKQNIDRGIKYYIDTVTINETYIKEKGLEYVEIKEKYLNYDHFNNQNDILVKSFLGTGKTNVICMLPEITDKSKNILIVPPRRLQTKDNFLRYNFIREDNEKIEDPPNGIYAYLNKPESYNRIICQPESFHLIPLDIVYDIVILDEIESSLMQFQSDTMKTRDDEKYKNQSSFSGNMMWDRYEEACIRLKKFCHEAKRVICADAFLSKKSIETYILFNRVLSTNTKPIFLNNVYIPEKNTVINIPIERYPKTKREDCTPLYNKIIEELTNGKKCFCIFSSKTRLDEFKILIKTLKKNFNGKFYYGGKTTLKNFDVEKEWFGLDFVAITTTITTGINFQKLWFDVAFVYWQATPLVRDIFQSLYRVRHLRDKKLYFCTSNFIFKKNMTSRECRIHKIKKEILDLQIPNQNVRISSDELFLTIKSYNIQSYRVQNLSLSAYKKIIEMFMGMCNFVWDEQIPPTFQPEIKKVKIKENETEEDIEKAEKNMYNIAYKLILDFDDKTKKSVIYGTSDDGNPLEKEIVGLLTFSEKYNIELNEINKNEIQPIYFNSKRPCLKEIFDKCYHLLKYFDREWDEDNYAMDSTNPKMIDVGRYVVLDEIKKKLNISLNINIQEQISNEDIKKLDPLKLKLYLETFFHFRDVKREGTKRIKVTKKDVTTSDNQRYLKHIFDFFGIELLRCEQKQKRINGKKIDVSDFYISQNDNIIILDKLRNKKCY